MGVTALFPRLYFPSVSDADLSYRQGISAEDRTNAPPLSSACIPPSGDGRRHLWTVGGLYLLSPLPPAGICMPLEAESVFYNRQCDG